MHQSVPGEASLCSSRCDQCVCVSHLQPSFSAEVCSARSVCFTVNGDSVLTRAAGWGSLIEKCWLVVFTELEKASQDQFISYWRELFQLMFVVNSWVYLGDRRHTVIVRHQTGNAEQVWLSLWHKRGWFWPLPNWWCVCLNPWSQIAVLSLINSRPLDFDCAALVFW